MEQITTVATALVSWAITGALGALVGFLATKLHSRTSHEKAMEVGMRCLLRQEIVDAYEKFIVDEKPISVERKREVIEAYEAYHDLGGDGLITDMYEEIKDKDTYIVR